MKEQESFNLIVINFFIGLIRGHRFLYPASKEFKDLGYQLFRIEPTFTINNGRVNPDAMAYSRKTKHTIMSEWTSSLSPNSDKQRQITRYLQVNRQHLVDNAAVPSDAADINGTWVIVRPETSGSFKCFCDSIDCSRLMLSSFKIDDLNGYCLEHITGELQDSTLSVLIKKGISVKRIPMGYIRVSIDNLKSQEFSDAVIQQVATYAVRKNYEFSAENIFEEMFKVSKLFDINKRKSIIGSINYIIKDIAKEKYLKGWLERVSPPLRWIIKIPNGKDVQTFCNRLDRFLSEKFNNSYQLKFDDLIDNET